MKTWVSSPSLLFLWKKFIILFLDLWRNYYYNDMEWV